MKLRLRPKMKPYPTVVIVLLSILVVAGSTESEAWKVEQLAQVESNGKSQMLPYHVLPVYGNASLGYYYVNIYIGSPNPQPQSVIIDTGSGILAVPCSSCKECGHKNHLNPPYDPTKSSSSQILTCQSNNPVCSDKCTFKQKTDPCSFSVHYAEGSSLQGTWVQDDIRLETIGKQEQIRTNFGCTQKETKLFFEQKANGIFGLAPKRQSNLLEKMFSEHSIWTGEKKVFSLCLSSNGGLMTVGGVNKKLHPHKTVPDISIPYSDTNNLYSLVGVREISIGEMFITSIVDRIGGYGIFIDSGSTFSYVPEAKYNQVEKLLNKTCIDSGRCKIGRGEDSICYRLDLQPEQNLFDQLNKMFPAVEINIQNKRIEWAPTKYMLLRSIKNNEVCMGLQPLNRYLLGANWMYDRDIVFDLDEKMIHIYDNVQCVNNTEVMGHYTTRVENNSDLAFTATVQERWVVNTSSPTFIIGIVCLVLAAIIAVLLVILGQNKPKEVPIVSSQEGQENSSRNNGSPGELNQPKIETTLEEGQTQ